MSSDEFYPNKCTKIYCFCNHKIQNDSPKFSIIDAITDISVASDFTTHQEF
jgi:hypothetical protein